MSEQVNCRVVGVSPINGDVYKVVLEPVTPLSHQAGQYLMVKMGAGDLRPFSIASAPCDGSLLELHIGAPADNRYAAEVVERLQTEREIAIEGPCGKAWYRASSGRPLLLIAGGTGYAYVRAILRQAQQTGHPGPIFVYWGVREQAHFYRLEQERAWAATAGTIHYAPVVEFPDERWSGKRGRVLDVVERDFVSLAGYDIYLAGRFEMAGVARERFAARGAESTHLYADAFEFIS